MLIEKILQQIVGWLAPLPSYPVKMARTGLAISLTSDGIERETLELLSHNDLRILAEDYCLPCHMNGHGANNPCVDCGLVRLFAAMALTERCRNTEAGS